jgi:hypothetical protein
VPTPSVPAHDIPLCPHCGREAPIVYRGVIPYCTACGALRAPLSTPSLNLAGKSSQMGGTVARVVGWVVLLVGLSIALGLGLLVAALFGSLAGALAVSLPVAVVALGVGLMLLLSGKALRRSGTEAERATRDQALLSMTAHHGPITAVQAARLLHVTVAAADAMLTALAKREPERIAIDVDDQGIVWYRIARPFGDDTGPGGLGPRLADPTRARVDGSDEPRDAGLAEEDSAETPGSARRVRR